MTYNDRSAPTIICPKDKTGIFKPYKLYRWNIIYQRVVYSLGKRSTARQQGKHTFTREKVPNLVDEVVEKKEVD